jgi:hypothetical protein
MMRQDRPAGSWLHTALLSTAVLALLAGPGCHDISDPLAVPGKGALGIARFSTVHTADQTTVVGLGADGAEIARLELSHGRIAVNEMYWDDWGAKEMDGRKVEVFIHGQWRLYSEIPGFDPVRRPGHPAGQQDLAMFLADPHVNAVTDRWGIRWEGPSLEAKIAYKNQSDAIEAGTQVNYWGATGVDHSGNGCSYTVGNPPTTVWLYGQSGGCRTTADGGPPAGYARQVTSGVNAGLWKPAVTCGGISSSFAPDMAIRATHDRPFDWGGKELLVAQKCYRVVAGHGSEPIHFAEYKSCSLVSGDGRSTFNKDDMSIGDGNLLTTSAGRITGGGCQPGTLYANVVNYSMSVSGSTLNACWDTVAEPDPSAFKTLTVTKSGPESRISSIVTNIPGPPVTRTSETRTACAGATIALDVLLPDPECGPIEFDGWRGACRGSEACTVTMDDDKSVNALFRLRACEGPAVWDPAACGCVPRDSGDHRSRPSR